MTSAENSEALGEPQITDTFETSDGFGFTTYDNGTATVTKYGNDITSEVPAEITRANRTYSVTAASGNTTADTVVLPSSVTTIKTGCFNSDGPHNIVIYGKITTIEENTLESQYIKNIFFLETPTCNVPASSMCGGQIDIYGEVSNGFNETNKHCTLKGPCFVDSYVVYTKYDDENACVSAFIDHRYIESLHIKDRVKISGSELPVTRICSFAFNNTSICQTYIPGSVLILEDAAFGYMHDLSPILHFSKTPYKIGNNTLNQDCFVSGINYNMLDSSNECRLLPDDVFCYDNMIFRTLNNSEALILGIMCKDCDVTVPDFVYDGAQKYKVTKIGGEAFKNVYLQSLTIPNSITCIGGRAFGNARIHAPLTIPGTVSYIGEEALSNAFLDYVIIKNAANLNTSGLDSTQIYVSDQPECFDERHRVYDSVMSDGTYLYGVLSDETLEFIKRSIITSDAMDIPSSVVHDGRTYTVTSINLIEPQSTIPEITIPSTVKTIKHIDCKIERIIFKAAPENINPDAFNYWGSAIQVYGITDTSILAGNKHLNACVSAFTFENMTFAVDLNGEAMLLSCLPETKNLNIPPEVTVGSKTYAVTSIANSADLGKIEELHLPDSITAIGAKVFAYNLPELTIPSSVRTIGEDAFTSPTLREVTFEGIPDSIGYGAFSSSNNCVIHGDVYSLFEKIKGLTFDNPTVTVNGAEYDIISENEACLRSLQSHVYGGSAYIPEEIEYKGKTFKVVAIASNAVQSGFEYLYIPATVDHIGYNGLNDGVKVLEFGSSNTKVEDCNLRVTVVVNHPAFTHCAHFDKIKKIGNCYYGLRNDGTAATTYCGDDTVVSSFEADGTTYTVTEVADYGSPFRCEMPDTITRIGDYAFTGLYMTQEIIPKSVRYIGDGAFSDCNTDLFIFEGRPDHIGKNAFTPSVSQSTVLSGNVADLFDDGYPRHITADPVFISEKGSVYKVIGPNKVSLCVFDENMADETLTVPQTVTNNGNTYRVCEIEKNAYGNRDIQCVIIPESVTHIAEMAFPQVHAINLGNHALKIDEPITASTEVVFSGENSKLLRYEYVNCRIADAVCCLDNTIYALYEDGSAVAASTKDLPKLTTTITYGERTYSLTELGKNFGARTYPGDFTIPAGIEKIDDGALKNTRLCSYTIPASVKYIGESAMMGDSGRTFVFEGVPEYIGYLACFARYSKTTVTGDVEHLFRDPYGYVFTPGEFEENKIRYERLGGGDVLVKGANSDNGYVQIPETVVHNGETYTVKGICKSSDIFATVIELPATIEFVGSHAFNYTHNLRAVIFNNDPAMMFSDMFGYMSHDVLVTGLVDSTCINGIEHTQYVEKMAWYNSMLFALDKENASLIFSDTSEYESVHIPSNFTSDGAVYTVTEVREHSVTGYAAYVPETVEKISSEGFINITKYIVFADSPKYVSTDAFGEQPKYICGYTDSASHPNADLRICERIFELNGISYANISGNELTIIHNTDNGIDRVQTDITYEGTAYTVTEIADRCFQNLTSRTLTIDEGVQRIGDWSFGGNMEKVYIPSTVKTIGNSFNISVLKMVKFRGTPESIGGQSFITSYHLTVVGDIPKEMFGYRPNIEFVKGSAEVNGVEYLIYPDGTVIATGLIDIHATAVEIEDKIEYEGKYNAVTSIGSNAFKDTEIRDVLIPNGIVRISDSAFENCDKIESIVIPSSVKHIDAFAFKGCDNLKFVNFEGTPESIDIQAFSEPKTVMHVTGDVSGIIHESDWIIVCKDLYLDKTIDLIDYGTGYNITRYESSTSSPYKVIIPSEYTTSDGRILKITGIGKELFKGWALEDAVISEGITDVGQGAFENCTHLRTVSLPKSLRTVDDHAFYGCTALTDVTFRSTLSEVGFCAFAGCPLSDTELYYSPAFDRDTFSECLVGSLWIPADIETIDTGFMALMTGLHKISVDPNNENFVVDDSGMLYSKDMKNLYLCPRTMTGPIELDRRTEIVADFAFMCCTHITEIIFPSGLRDIGEYSFGNCWSLNSVKLPDKLDTLDFGAFAYCISLCDITLPSEIEKIMLYAFDGCTSLTSIVLPNGLIEIGDGAFMDSGLKNVEVPSSVVSIGENVFKDAPLTVARFHGSPSVGSGSFTGNTMITGHEDLTKITQDNRFFTDAVYEHGGLQFRLHADGNAEVINSTDAVPSNLVIPSEITAFGTSYTVSSIGYRAFYGNQTLDVVSIPNTVTRIGEAAFQNASISVLNLPTTKTALGKECIVNTAITAFTVPDWMSEIDFLTYNVLIKELHVETGHASLKDVDGVLFSDDGKVLVSFPAGRTGAYTVPDHTESISAGAFRNTHLEHLRLCEGITGISEGTVISETLHTLELPSTTSRIEDGAIGSSAMDALTVPKKTFYLGTFADMQGRELPKLIILKGPTLVSQEITDSDIEIIRTDSVRTADGLEYRIEPDGATLIGQSGSSEHIDLHVPSSITIGNKEYNVVRIGDMAFMGCDTIRTLSVPDTVRDIGYKAFSSCGLTSMDLPAVEVSVGELAFSDNGFETVVIPAWMKEYNGYFSGCLNLTSFTVQEGNREMHTENGALYLGRTLVQYPAGTTGDVWVPNHVEEIGSHAFDGCRNLTSINIPDRTTRIGDFAFRDCTGLRSFSISAGITNIGDTAFIGCDNLVTIYMRSCNIMMGTSGCPSNTFVDVYGPSNNSINVPAGCFVTYHAPDWEGMTATVDGVTYTVEDRCAHATSVTNRDRLPSELNIPITVRIGGGDYLVTTLAPHLFKGCTSLQKVTLPASINRISEACFEDCTNLKSIVQDSKEILMKGAPDTVRNSGILTPYDGRVTSDGDSVQIGAGAFRGCTSLEDIRMSDNTVSVGTEAFKGCTALTTLKLAPNTETIGDSAFEGCASLESVVLPKKVTTVGNKAFKDCGSVESVIIENKNTEIMEQAFDLGKQKQCKLSVPEGFDKEQLGTGVEFIPAQKISFEYVGAPAGTDRLQSTILSKGETFAFDVPTTEGYDVQVMIDGTITKDRSVTMEDRDITVTFLYELQPEPEPETSPDKDEGEDLPIGLIAGVGAAVLALIVIAAVVMKRRA